MKAESIRNFLGIFYLGITFFIGAYIQIFKGTSLLNISDEESSSAFQIVVPTFISQLAIIYRWFSKPPPIAKEKILMPKWLVVGPPLLVSIFFIVVVAVLIITQGAGLKEGVFKGAMTFSVSFLGATSAIIILRMFGQENRE